MRATSLLTVPLVSWLKLWCLSTRFAYCLHLFILFEGSSFVHPLMTGHHSIWFGEIMFHRLISITSTSFQHTFYWINIIYCNNLKSCWVASWQGVIVMHFHANRLNIYMDHIFASILVFNIRPCYLKISKPARCCQAWFVCHQKFLTLIFRCIT